MQRHQIVRHRHETRRRSLVVETTERLSPTMMRIVLSSPDLRDFVSAAADDHIKLSFPPAAADGEDAKPQMRDFTPRAFDPQGGTLTIDFALHDAGPATEWAMKARIGDTLEIGGPRGSAVIPDDFDWYLLVGDETALPAIGRRVEELRPGVPVVTVVIVADGDDAQDLETEAAWKPVWIVRDRAQDDAVQLIAALQDIDMPSGEGFVWVAAEADVARAVRVYMVEFRDHPREWMKAAGYWTKGLADTHMRIED